MVAAVTKPGYVSPQERDVLRKLAERQAELAELPAQAETEEAWRRLNGLRPARPMVWIEDVPWDEMNVEEALTLRCSDPFLRQVERDLRTTLYRWDRLRADMVVEARYDCPLVIENDDFGLADAAAAEARPRLRTPADVDKLPFSAAQCNDSASKEQFAKLMKALGGALPVEERGVVHQAFAPWDRLAEWCGATEALAALMRQPAVLHAAMSRLLAAHLRRLAQYEELNVLSLNNGNVRTGAGGLGYCDDLPLPEFNPGRVRPGDQWGCATVRTHPDISPAMHAEFALPYEQRWLERFGLACFGGAQPPDADLLKALPRLRKVRLDHGANLGAAVEALGDRCVLSYHPNPAPLTAETWAPEAARRELADVLDRTRGCAVEIVLTDVGTVRRQPRRLWEWAKLATEIVAAA